MVEPGFDVPDDELLSRTYLLLKRTLPPTADWREYALATVPGGADGTVNVHIDGDLADVFDRVCDIPVGQG